MFITNANLRRDIYKKKKSFGTTALDLCETGECVYGFMDNGHCTFYDYAPTYSSMAYWHNCEKDKIIIIYYIYMSITMMIYNIIFWRSYLILIIGNNVFSISIYVAMPIRQEITILYLKILTKPRDRILYTIMIHNILNKL